MNNILIYLIKKGSIEHQSFLSNMLISANTCGQLCHHLCVVSAVFLRSVPKIDPSMTCQMSLSPLQENLLIQLLITVRTPFHRCYNLGLSCLTAATILLVGYKSKYYRERWFHKSFQFSSVINVSWK